MNFKRLPDSSGTFQRAGDIVNVPQRNIFNVFQTCFPRKLFLRLSYGTNFPWKPTLRITDLIQSLTFEDGKLHYSETEKLAAKFNHLLVTWPGHMPPSLASSVNTAKLSSCCHPLPLGMCMGFVTSPFPVIEIHPPLATVARIRICLTSRAFQTNLGCDS